jgi:hypothetical protein
MLSTGRKAAPILTDAAVGVGVAVSRWPAALRQLRDNLTAQECP